MPGPPARVAVAVALAGLVAVAGCGGDDGEADADERARLEDSLGFLKTDLGLSDEELACTADTIEEDLGGEDLDRFAAQIRQVDSGEISVEDLEEADSVILTGAIATCAAGT